MKEEASEERNRRPKEAASKSNAEVDVNIRGSRVAEPTKHVVINDEAASNRRVTWLSRRVT